MRIRHGTASSWLAYLVVVVPVLIGVVALSRLTWYPAGDWGLIDVAVRDVGSRTPLLGPYSRYGWFHPGPMLYLVLAVPYRLLGSQSIDLAIGSLLVNGLVFASILAVARRRGGYVLATLTFTLTAVLCLAFGGDLLVTPWGPHATLLPFLLLILLAWSASCGDEIWALPCAAFVATFMVQSHVSYVIIAGALLVWTGGWWLGGVAAARRGDEWRRARTGFAWSLASTVTALLVLWSPVVWEQLTRDPGNLTLQWRYLRAHTTLSTGYASIQPMAGPKRAWHLLAAQFDLWSPWMGAHQRINSFTSAVAVGQDGPVPFALLALVGGGALAWWKRQTDALKLCVLVAILVPIAWLTTATIRLPFADFLLRWTWVLGMMCWLATFWAISCAAGPRLRRRVRPVALAVSAVAVVVLVVALSADLWDARPSSYSTSPAVPDVSEATVRWLHRTDTSRTVYFQSDGVYGGGIAVADQLVRAGVDLRVRVLPPSAMGEHRRYSGQAAVTPLFVTGDPDRISLLKRTPGFALVAIYEAFGAARRRQVAAALATLRTDPTDRAARAVLARYQGRARDRLAVFRLDRPDRQLPAALPAP